MAHANTLSTFQRVTTLGPLQYVSHAAGQRMLRPNPPALTMAENREHVLKLYRKIVRSVPRVLMVSRRARVRASAIGGAGTPLIPSCHREIGSLALVLTNVRSMCCVSGPPLQAYEITGGPMLEREAIRNIRDHFERNRGVTDPGVVAVLRHKCEMEVSESLLLWKTKSHVCNLVLNAPSTPIAALMAKQQVKSNLPPKAQQSHFLSSFYQG
jgi:hypothetical protein